MLHSILLLKIYVEADNMAEQTQFQKKYGSWALVTGASAGIGEEFAKQIASRGLNVVIVARRKEKLEALADQLHGEYQVDVRVVALNLSDPDFMDTLTQHTDDIEIGLLVNNAGVYFNGAFLDISLENQLATLLLNTRAPLLLTHYYAQKMKDRGHGGIIIVSSTATGLGNPYNANYSATKSYGRYLAEGLSHELRESGVDVQAFLAGGVDTEGTKRLLGDNPSKSLTAMLTQPEPVVRTSLDKLGKQMLVIPGAVNNVMVAVTSRFMPRELALRLYGKMSQMIDN